MLVFNEARVFIEKADAVKEDARKQIEALFKLYNRGMISLDEFLEEGEKVKAETDGKLKELNRDMVGTLSYLAENGYNKIFEG